MQRLLIAAAVIFLIDRLSKGLVVRTVRTAGVDRVLAAQHQVTHPRQIYLHSFWASVPPRGADDGMGIRGAAAIQVSTPTVTLPSGSTGSRVTIHFQAMVHMQPRAGSVEVPAFVHGEIQAALDVDQVTSTAEDILTIDLSGDDVELTFIPASSASPAGRR